VRWPELHLLWLFGHWHVDPTRGKVIGNDDSWRDLAYRMHRAAGLRNYESIHWTRRPILADPADPRCSSVYADLRDLPPVLIQVRDDEILFDDAARIRDAAISAGVDTTFAPWAHGIHVWPVYISAGLPESALAIENLAAFLKVHS
jgi:acetyl esterase/lipase